MPLHPPGFYGSRDCSRAVNALAQARRWHAPIMGRLAVHEGALAISPPSICAAGCCRPRLVGLMIDALVSSGSWAARRCADRRRLPLSTLAAALGLVRPPSARAAEVAPISDRDMDAALSTRLAYVVTGDATVDETSKLGLDGADPRACFAHLGRTRRAGRGRSGARRTRLLSADLLADRRWRCRSRSLRRERASPRS